MGNTPAYQKVENDEQLSAKELNPMSEVVSD